MGTSTQWQLAREAAERYERILVPALLGPYAQSLVHAAAVAPGEAVLDVGCGTGAAARAAALRGGRTTGIDVNPGMLEVARSLPQGDTIGWREARAERLPFENASFHVVVCAQTLQFVPDRRAALAEMRRVLKPGGRLALGVWASVHHNPYFEALIAAAACHLGDDAAAGLRAVFSLGDAGELRALLADTGWPAAAVEADDRELPLPPLPDFVPRHLSATPLAAAFAAAAPAVQGALVSEVGQRLGVRSQDEGLRLPFRAHRVTVRLPPA